MPSRRNFGGVMTENNETLMIESSTLSEWMSADEVCLYDVREEHEFAKSRIPGSTLLPISIFDAEQVTLAGKKKLVFHCRSGIRCGQAAELMRFFGYHGPIYRLEGGIIAWAENGGKMEPGGN